MSFIELLFETITPETFAAQHWNGIPLHQEHQTHPALTPLMDSLHLDTWVESGVLRAPRLRLRKAGSWLHDAVFTRGVRLGINAVEGMADLNALRAMQAQGISVWAGELQRLAPNLGSACRDLAQYLQVPATVAAWMLPANAQIDPALAAMPRWFVQLSGESVWVVTPGTATDAAGELEATATPQRFCLKRGDSLFMPNGYQAQVNTDSSSAALLLDISLQALTYMDCLRQVVSGVFNELEADPAWRTTALGTTPTPVEVSTWRKCYATQAHALKIDEAALTHFVRNHADPAAVAGVLTTLCASPHSENQYWVGQPNHITAQGGDEHTLTLISNQKELTLPQTARETLAFLLQPKTYRVDEIPGSISDQEKSALLRQLMLEGLVMPVSQASTK